jgi:hypothetical protein
MDPGLVHHRRDPTREGSRRNITRVGFGFTNFEPSGLNS